jgi:hypothetical protein
MVATVGDRMAFCNFIVEIDAAADATTSEDQALESLKSFEARFDAILALAPTEVRADFQTMINASREAIAEGTVRAVEDPNVSTAGYRLDRYCSVPSK